MSAEGGGLGEGMLSQTKTTIVLHGALAKRYGRRHTLGVRTAPQAAYALCTLIPGFREEFQDGWYRVVRGRVADGITLTERELHLQAPPGGEIHFIPVARGGKNSGGIKAVLGAVILVAAVVASAGALAPVGIVGGGLAATSALGVSYGAIAFFGATMLLSGVSALLSSTSNKLANQIDPLTSYSLTGNTNSTAEGTPIPVVYGRTRVGSVVGSFGYYAENYDGSSAPSPEPAPANGGSGNSGAVGGKGSKGGSTTGGATEAPNTLRSRAVVRLIDILSEGPIGGLVDGPRSIFFNNTPLMASDGSYNFQGVTWEIRNGYPSQDAIAGYPASEETHSVNVEVQHLGAGAVVRTYTSTTATAARVTMRLPSLLHQNTTNGNLEAYPDLRYTIEVAPAGSGAYAGVVAEAFEHQKCTSPYEKSYRFNLPNTGSWDIRVTKVTADATTSNDQCSVFWEATTLITDQALMHPNVAYAALTIDSAAFGSQIPTRAYEIDGILCQVPYNYDPPSGTYATTGPGTSLGTWDGASFKLQATSNPAWCLYDMLTNQRYGLALPAQTAVSNTKYDLFIIGQYCDGTVPSGFTDGNGNMIQERRYTLNAALTQQVDAYRLLQSMVSAFRGMTYWGAGRVVVTADMPAQPSYVLNSGNVIDGEFTYEGSALKTRHTVCRVSWIDPNNSYMEAIEVVEDFDTVVNMGQVPTDIVAFGCTSRGLARRWGKWLLDTERHQTELMSCGVGLEELRSRPGDIVRVADTAYAGLRQGGRVKGLSNNTILFLDQPVTVTPGLDYKLTCALADGTVADKVGIAQIYANPDGNAVVIPSPPLPGTVLPGAAWILSTTGPAGLQPVDTRQFRILALAEPHRGQYQISALVHDPNKYARVELGIEFDPTPFSTLNGLLVAPLPPPTNVAAVDYIVGVGTTTVIRVSVGWTPANDVRVVGQQIHAQGPEQRDASADGNTIDIDGLMIGQYVFRVRSVGRDGRTSIWADSPSILVDGMADPPDAPLNFTAQGGAMQVRTSWNSSAARDIMHYELWRSPADANGTHPFPYSGYTPVGSPSSNNAVLVVKIAGTSFLDSGDDLAPDTAWAYWVRAINTTGGASPFTGPIKALTTYYITDNLQEGIRNTAPIAEALLGSAPAALKDLSNPGTFDGQLALNASDSKLYRWNGKAKNGLGQWELYIPLVPDNLGKLSADQVSAINAAQIVGAFTSEQAAGVVAAIADGQITDRMIDFLEGSKVSGRLSNAIMEAGRIYDVDPVTGDIIKGVDVSKLLGQIVGTQITDGSITSDKIGANQVTAQHITAGSITGNSLAIAGPGNVVGNPNCQATAWGWRLSSSGSALGYAQVGSVTGDNIGNGQFALAGEGSGGMTASGTMAVGDSMTVVWDPDAIGGTPCQPGDWWEAQAYLGAQRCYGVVGLQFFDHDGIALGGINSSRVATAPGGSQLTSYGFTWTKASAPPGAARVKMSITAANDGGSDIGQVAGQNPYLFFTHAMLAPSTALPLAGGAQPQPYTIGGVTQVVGGSIKTSAITARQISAGAIDATKLSVGSVSNVITNSCCTVAASGWLCTAAMSAVPVYSQWLLSGFGTGQVLASSMAPGMFFDTSWAPDGAPYKPDGTNAVAWGAAISCTPGDLWEAQAQIITVNCSSTLMLVFLAQGTDGSWQVARSTNTGAQAWATPADGRTLGQYHQQAVRSLAPGPGTYGGVSCPNGATLVTLVIRMGNDSASQAVFGGGTQSGARLYFTQTALGIAQTATAPMEWAPGGSTQIDGGQIKANSITAGTLAAGAVVAGNIAAGAITASSLAAGSITADKLSVGDSTNLIWNPCPNQRLDGWSGYTYGPGMPGVGDPRVYMGPAAAANGAFVLAGSGSGLAFYNSPSETIFTNQGFVFDWAPGGAYGPGLGYGVPAQAGQTWAASAWLITYALTGFIQVLFYDYAGNQFPATASATAVNNTLGNGYVLDNYTRVSVFAVAPPGTATVVMRIQGSGLNTNQPYLCFTQAMLGQVPAGTTAVPPWQPGGVTTISGGMIKTNTLNAQSIVAGSITAREVAIGSLRADQIISSSITSTQIAAGSVSADKLVANSITAGQIQAGAIGATQIAAGQIRSVHLAADFALISSAQIGTAVIDSAQIKHLAVGNFALGYGAATYSAYAVSGGGHTQEAPQLSVYNLSDYLAGQCGVLLMWRTDLAPEPNSGGGTPEGGGG